MRIFKKMCGKLLSIAELTRGLLLNSPTVVESAFRKILIPLRDASLTSAYTHSS